MCREKSLWSLRSIWSQRNRWWVTVSSSAFRTMTANCAALGAREGHICPLSTLHTYWGFEYIFFVFLQGEVWNCWSRRRILHNVALEALWVEFWHEKDYLGSCLLLFMSLFIRHAPHGLNHSSYWTDALWSLVTGVLWQQAGRSILVHSAL